MKLLNYLLVAVLIFAGISCSDDDDDKMPTVLSMSGFSYSQAEGKVTVKWDPIEDAVAYQVFYNEIAQSDLPITSTTFVFDAQKSNASLKVEAYEDAEMTRKIGEASIEYFAMQGISGLYWTAEGEQVKLQWDALENAVAYKVIINDQTSSSKHTKDNFLLFDEIEDQSKLTVLAYKDEEAKICIGTAVITYVSPKEMTGIVVKNEKGNYSLVWGEVEGAAAYNVYVDGVAASESAITGTSFELATIKDKQVVEVKAFIDAEMKMCVGEGVLSLLAVKDIQDVGIEAKNEKFTISWAKVERAIAYHVFVNEEKKSTQPLTEPTFVLESLVDGDVVKVEAYYDAKASITIGKGHKTYRSLKSFEIKDTGYNTTYEKVLVNFYVLEGTYDYYLYFSESATGPFVKAKDEKNSENSDDIILDPKYSSLWLDVDDDNLKGNTTYYFKVVAKEVGTEKIVGESQVDSYAVPTLNADKLAKPVVTLTKTGNTVTIKWNFVSKAVSYDVYVSSDGSSKYQSKLGNTTSNSYDHVSDFNKNVKMYYRVKAISATGKVSYSDWKSIWW
ncbi:MAG: hypothetical protein ACEPOZ_12395 [Marinifilaceae bacterium]